MKLPYETLFAAAGVAALSLAPAHSQPGVLIGLSAGVPSPGIYMFNQVFTYQANLTGPGTTTALGGSTHTGVQAAIDAQGLLFVPGWTFLGATYDAVIVALWVDSSFGSPVNTQAAGAHNAFINPGELSWKFGDSGLVFKTGLGIYTPDGTINGPGGLGNQGFPYWTIQPEAIFSYLKNGWNLTAAIYQEFHTRNTINQYQTGDILHADFTTTKTIGKWTLGPVAYYVGQVTNDNSPIVGATFGSAQRYDIWAVGGLVAYDFGAATLSVWATQEVSAKAWNAAAVAAGLPDVSLIPQGSTLFATLSYQIWAPKKPMGDK